MPTPITRRLTGNDSPTLRLFQDWRGLSAGPSLPPAVLAVGAPEVAAFMSDEAVAAVPGLPVLQYTLKHYLLYLGQVQERARALSRGEGTVGGLGG